EVQAISSSQIALFWKDNSSIETGFIIERSTNNSNDFDIIRVVGPNTTGFTDKGLLPSRQYTYRIRATDGTNFSPYTRATSDITLSPQQTVPRTPSKLKAQALSSKQIALKWQDNANNETDYVIERSTSLDGPFVTVDTVAANSTTYIDKGLTPGTTYFYRVRARSGTIRSVPSNIAQASTISIAAKKKTAAQIAAIFSTTPLNATV
ncbi:MAG TPA: fibronectin type III domain-containing protein, partial [Tepidisphaeraceae bacterium]|nr:fibronectin type III domain-containing protein [Tepidisphaeraceae bacterium]